MVLTCSSIALAKDPAVDAILNKAENISSFSCGLRMTLLNGFGYQLPENVAESKVWFKKGYMKTDVTLQNERKISVARPDGSYVFSSKTGKFNKLNNDLGRPVDIYDALDYMVLKELDYKNLGVETLEGKEVTVLEAIQEKGSLKIKNTFWIWNERGIPLKYKREMGLEGGSIDTLFEYHDFKFEELPDSSFELVAQGE